MMKTTRIILLSTALLSLYVTPALHCTESFSRQARQFQGNLAYNDYPFSLPVLDTVANTAYFSTKAGETPGDLTLEEVSLLDAPQALRRDGALHIVLEGAPDLAKFHDFATYADNQQGQTSYFFHFFGPYGTDSTSDVTQGDSVCKSMANLCRQWKKDTSAAACKGLDFALRLPASNRKQFIQQLRELLTECPKLETLSIRFMGLTTAELTDVVATLKQSTPNLKRLILPFNALDDAAMTSDGALADLLSTGKVLGQLHVFDVRGNEFTAPETWNVQAIRNRYNVNRTDARFYFGYNCITESQQRNAPSLVPLRGLGRTSQFDQPKDFTLEDAKLLKNVFNGGNAGGDISKQLFSLVQHADDETVKLSEFFTLLRYGNLGAMRSLNLSYATSHNDPESKQPTVTYRSFADNTFPIEVLRYLKTKDALRVLNLEGVFNTDFGAAGNEAQHQALVDEIKKFKQLQYLSLSRNTINDFVSLYEQLWDEGAAGSEGSTSLRQLRTVDFSNHTISVEKCAEFLGSLGWSVSVANEDALNLRRLNLANMHFHEDHFIAFVNMLDSKTLGFLEVSNHAFTLTDAKKVEAFLKAIEKRVAAIDDTDLRDTPLYYIDLSCNAEMETQGNSTTEGLSAECANRLVERYQAAISQNPNKAYPVLKINGRLPSGEWSPARYVSSVKGFSQLAMVYQAAAKAKPGDNWEGVFNEAPQALLKKSYFFSGQGIKANNKRLFKECESLIKGLNAVKLGLPQLIPTTREKYLKTAVSILQVYQLPAEAADVSLRAQISAYFEENAKHLQGQSVAARTHKNRIFLLLSVAEQEARLKNTLSAFYRQSIGLLTKAQMSAADKAQAKNLLKPETIVNQTLDDFNQ